MAADHMTYTRCPRCDGTLVMPADLRTPTSSGGETCLCCLTPTPGLEPTGVTLAQLERFADRELAIAGDPGIPHARRGEILIDLDVRLRKAIDDWTREGT